VGPPSTSTSSPKAGRGGDAPGPWGAKQKPYRDRFAPPPSPGRIDGIANRAGADPSFRTAWGAARPRRPGSTRGDVGPAPQRFFLFRISRAFQHRQSTIDGREPLLLGQLGSGYGQVAWRGARPSVDAEDRQHGTERVPRRRAEPRREEEAVGDPPDPRFEADQAASSRRCTMRYGFAAQALPGNVENQ